LFLCGLGGKRLDSGLSLAGRQAKKENHYSRK
jgi:hypothetical protein